MRALLLLLPAVWIGLFTAAAPSAAAGHVEVVYWLERADAGTFDAHLRITNRSPDPIFDWHLAFDFGGTVTSVQYADWSAAGRRVTLRGTASTYAIAPGAHAWVRLSGTHSGGVDPPTGCTFDGVACAVSVYTTAGAGGPEGTGDGGGGTDAGNGTARLQPHFRYTSVWGGGYVAQVSLVNVGDGPVSEWALGFSLPASIGQLWNGRLRRAGGNYVVSSVDWNAVIAPGDSAYFGFQGGYAGALGPPADCTVNGVACTFVVSGVPETPDPGPAVVGVTFSFTSVWEGGYVAAVTLTNAGTSPILGWEIGFDFGAGIGGLWNGRLARRAGRFFVGDVGYNAMIAPGGSTVFGFQGSYAGTLEPPSGCTFNDDPCTVTVRAAVVAAEEAPAVPQAALRLEAYPRPWRGGPLTVQLQADRPQPLTLTLYDALGRRIWRHRAPSTTAGQVLRAVVPPPPVAGLYWLRLTGDGGATAVQAVPFLR